MVSVEDAAVAGQVDQVLADFSTAACKQSEVRRALIRPRKLDRVTEYPFEEWWELPIEAIPKAANWP